MVVFPTHYLSAESYSYMPHILLSVLYLCFLIDLYQPHRVNISTPRVPSPHPPSAACRVSEHRFQAMASKRADVVLDRVIDERMLQLWFVANLFVAHNFALWFIGWRVTHLGNKAITQREMIGFSIGVAGAALRLWSRLTLGRFFTYIVTIRSGHRLVTDGPYRVLLHPSYTGAVLLQLGYVLFNASWLLAAYYLLFTGLFLYARVRNEESVLEAEFGDEFVKRRNNVARFIPFVY